jgi:hypothetical protein
MPDLQQPLTRPRNKLPKFLAVAALAAALVGIPAAAAYAVTTDYFSGGATYGAVKSSPTTTIKGNRVQSQSMLFEAHALIRKSSNYQVYEHSSAFSAVNITGANYASSHGACYWTSPSGYTSGSLNLYCRYDH